MALKDNFNFYYTQEVQMECSSFRSVGTEIFRFCAIKLFRTAVTNRRPLSWVVTVKKVTEISHDLSSM